MPKVITVDQKQAVRMLHSLGWSNRRIGRELGIDRRTVGKYVAEAAADVKCTGNQNTEDVNDSPVPDEQQLKCTTNPNTGSQLPAQSRFGPRSSCEDYHDLIEQKLTLGLHGQRIYQDLRADHGYAGSAQSVRRYIRRIRKKTPLPFRVMHSLPGEECQVDFGQGAHVLQKDGKRRKRPHLFRIVLSHSRKAYSEVVWRQDTESFLRCIENAFIYFGGVPKTVVTDNLKAAVIKADWYDPEINPKLRSFAEDYGCVIMPTKPYTPEHKGKVENGVKYCQDNALKGREFSSLAEQNNYLRDWEKNVADTRIHGTTQSQVRSNFENTEKDALQPLPPMLFPCFEEGERKVQSNGHVEVTRAFYSAPPEYLGQYLWVRYDSRTVRIFNSKMKQVAVHSRKERGQYSTNKLHIPDQKVNAGERGTGHLLKRIHASIGAEAAIWSEVMLQNRGLPGIRVMQGLLSLKNKHSATTLNQTAISALSNEVFNLPGFRAMIDDVNEQQSLQLTEIHPLIRKVSSYAELTPNVFETEKEETEGAVL